MKALAFRLFTVRHRAGRVAGWALVALLGFAPTFTIGGQTGTATHAGSSRPDPGDASNGLGPLNPGNPAKLEHLREDERRKRLLADTAKLVELSNDLKAQVERSSKDELSLDVVRKAAELEKLARDVKERMKN